MTRSSKTIKESEVTLIQMLFQNQTNPFGTAHGGELIKIMDNAAGICASKHAETMVATRGIYNVDFHAPAHPGDLIHCHAHITYVSNHAMEIFVELLAEDLLKKKFHSCVTAFFVYLSLDEKMNLLEVPNILIENAAEANEFQAGKIRMENRKRA
jgi:acyl-CoA hydrolase